MSAFSGSLNTLFRDPNMSVAATYCPLAGPEVSLRALFWEPEEAGAQILGVGQYLPAYLAEVRSSDVAEPREGDELVIDSVRYRVSKAERKADGLAWRLDLEKQE